jgi:hypothetical protein
MTEQPWQDEWLLQSVATQTMLAWRGVEAQHVVSTMRLADTVDEQFELEKILEQSKPPMPVAMTPKHYLLATPFRYRPHHPSRFRRASSLGVWYGAQTLKAACAEVAYWRWRFIMDSEPLLSSELLTEHTFFQTRVTGIAIDLTQPPWLAARPSWVHASDYSATQALADEARDKAIEWIRYESVREPKNQCAAVLDVNALEMVAGGDTSQSWHCKTTRQAVTMARAADRFSWDF